MGENHQSSAKAAFGKIILNRAIGRFAPPAKLSLGKEIGSALKDGHKQGDLFIIASGHRAHIRFLFVRPSR